MPRKSSRPSSTSSAIASKPEARGTLGIESYWRNRLVSVRIRDSGRSFEAIAFFQKNSAGILVIVLTGYPDVKLAVDFMKEGVVDYLVKPVEKSALVAAVGRAAEQRSTFSTTQPPL